MYKLTYHNRINNSGFTLIELMVATSVFLIIVALSTGVFVQTLRTQRTLTKTVAANEGASQVLEQMSREVRTGYNFAESTKDILTFTSVQLNNTIVSYSLGSCANDSMGRKCIQKAEGSNQPYDLTAPEMNIESLGFKYPGNTPVGNGPTRVTVLITVGSEPGQPSDIQTHLETTISSRNINK